MWIACLHGALVAVAAIVSVAAGWPVRGVVLGGSAMGGSLILIWGTARLTLAGNRTGLALLASAKVLLYAALLTAVLTGWLVADGEGFAVGITCFVVATLSVVTVSSRRRSLA